MQFELCLVTSLLIFCNLAFSIKCWVCRSDTDPKCADPFDNSTVPITDCSHEPYMPHLPPPFNHHVPQMCRKTRQKVFGQWRYFRSCAYLGEPGIRGDERFCLMRTGTYNIFMEYCQCNSKDGCNTGSMRDVFTPFACLVAGIFVFLTSRFVF